MAQSAASFFRYAGGKHKLSTSIVEKLRVHLEGKPVQYREPFFGGGSVGLSLLNANLLTHLWMNDKDLGLACLWTAVIRYPEALQQLVQAFTPSTAAFYAYKAELLTLTEAPDYCTVVTEIGFKKLALHQISYSGLAEKSGGPLGGDAQLSKYPIDCRWAPEYICKKIGLIHAALSTVTIHEDRCTDYDFREVIKSPGERVLYLDPPYFNKGNDLYKCGFSVEDHVELAEILRSVSDPWLLSYDDCPDIRYLYKGLPMESTEVMYNITATKDASGKRLSRKKPELFISNGI